MNRTLATSPRAAAALALVESLQAHFVRGLESIGGPFERVEWLRDGGTHGGGTRFQATTHDFFNNASVNVSQVHYDDDPKRPMASATALSTIVHPQHPLRPSVHIHVSFTELRSGKGTWRLMADLNPSNPNAEHTDRFRNAVAASIPQLADRAREQGDRYFFIPALHRTRGVTHFYIEDFAGDGDTASHFGRAAIDSYLSLLSEESPMATDEQRVAQLGYHTLYLFQVLTLDRGTTSGLLVHDQNDVGIMGSLPARVDPSLLASWEAKVPEVQRSLVRSIALALGTGDVTPTVRAALANIVRSHYRAHPEALELQASGDVIPPTVANHGS